MRMFNLRRSPSRLKETARTSLVAPLVAAAALALASAPGVAQDDDESGEEASSDEGDARADKPSVADVVDAPKPAEDVTSLVRATDREPRPGTPLIQNKLFPMGLTLEITPTFDYAYSEKWISHIGGHLSVGFHIFEWLGIEGFAGGFYPRELAITQTVRQRGYSWTSCVAGTNCEPKLSDLWQSVAFGGAVVEWAPLYGKLSIVSEFDLSFQLYFLGGGAVELTAKPVTEVGGIVNNNNDFYTGLISGKQFSYNPRISAAYGAGLRLIPWKWVALRLELRNLTGLNPPVPGYEDEQLFDISNLPLISVGVSLLI